MRAYAQKTQENPRGAAGQFEILRVQPDLTVTIPDLVVIPFEVSDGLKRRLAEVKEELGPKAKRQRTSEEDVMPRRMSGEELPPGFKAGAHWDVQVRTRDGATMVLRISPP